MKSEEHPYEGDERLAVARAQFAKSVERVERQVDKIEDSISDVASTVSGQKLWKEHFWATAIGSLAVGALLGRPKPSSSRTVPALSPHQLARLEDRLQHSVERLELKMANRSGGSSSLGSVVKRKVLANPAFMTSLLSLGVNMLASGQNRDLEDNTSDYEMYH